MKTEVLWIARYDYKVDWYVPKHVHDFYQLIYILKGKGSFIVGDKSYILEESNYIIFRPNEEHSFAANLGVPLFTMDTKFQFDIDVSLKNIENFGHVGSDDNNYIQRLLEDVRLEGIKKQNWYRQMSNATFNILMIQIIRNSNSVRLNEKKHAFENIYNESIIKVKKYIESNYFRDLELEEIASNIGYSAEYLANLFKKTTGETIHNYIILIRINEARRLLIYTNQSIKEISYATGFKTIHHFSRVFKKVTGLPPATWKKHEQLGVWEGVVFDPEFKEKDKTHYKDGNTVFDEKFK